MQTWETGIERALLNASQQIGVVFGLAFLSKIAVLTGNRVMPNTLQQRYQDHAAGDMVLM
ncbi:hypothetical protein [Microvirgula curvata]